MSRGADLQQQIELLPKERVIVGEIQAEPGERLGERAPANDQVDAPIKMSLRDEASDPSSGRATRL
jgi:hypothetical protein